jgi:16S rRNA (uracil1498-N3)-methyltransferase
MAHQYRFFGEKDASGAWRLEDDEAHHAIKVLRLSGGEVIELVDGKGTVATGRLVLESKSKAAISDVSEVFTPKDPFCRCILLGALKPGDVDDLIAPVVELGADKLIIFHQADTAQYRTSDSALERWQRLVRSAVKQSKRPWSVEIKHASSLAAALDLTNDLSHHWILLPEAKDDLLSFLPGVTTGRGVAVLIGGEKGFTQTEQDHALALGYKPVRLGPYVLRARTAAQAAAVFLGMMPRS